MPVVAEAPKDLKAELLMLWRRLLKSQAVSDEDDFFESGGDSLLAMEMLIEVEQLIGHPVPETIMFGAETIRQLLPRVVEQGIVQASPLHTFHADGDRPPLYFFHGDFLSGGLSVQRMVKLFGPDHPIITIDPHGMYGEQIPVSIEAMAADHLPLILERQASGPFLVGGHCKGALVAFETTRLLVAAGHRVEMVVMIDPPTVSARPVMRAMLKLLKHIASPHRLVQTYHQMTWLERSLKMPLGDLLAKSHERLNGKKLRSRSLRHDPYTITMAQYLPAPFDVPVVFYAASHEGRAWRRLSPQLEVIEVPGGHSYCLTTGAELLVKHLKQRIDSLAEVTVPQG